MVNKIGESERKRTFSLTLNPELVEWMRQDAHISNFSAWVNEMMRDYKLRLTRNKVCPCGVSMGRAGWARHQGICPVCHHDHATEDKRKIEVL